MCNSESIKRLLLLDERLSKIETAILRDDPKLRRSILTIILLTCLIVVTVGYYYNNLLAFSIAGVIVAIIIGESMLHVRRMRTAQEEMDQHIKIIVRDATGTSAIEALKMLCEAGNSNLHWYTLHEVDKGKERIAEYICNKAIAAMTLTAKGKLLDSLAALSIAVQYSVNWTSANFDPSLILAFNYGMFRVSIRLVRVGADLQLCKGGNISLPEDVENEIRSVLMTGREYLGII